MGILNLSHKKPILFAEKTIYIKDNRARVLVRFETIPTLPMIIEAAAQSSAALSLDEETHEGFLVGIKDIILMQKSTEKRLEIEVHQIHSFDEMNLIDFQIFENDSMLGRGNLIIKSS